MPLVSVIIPTYNRREFLLEAIESLRRQDWPELEIIVIDDGSTDDTPAALAALDEPRLRYQRQTNAGRSAARNRGLDLAEGELICFLDDDDLFLPGKVTAQAQALLDNPEVDIVGSGWRGVDHRGESVDVACPWVYCEEPTLLNLLQKGCASTPSSITVRRDALHRHNLYFDPLLHYAEDTDFLLRLLARGCRMAWVPSVLTAYRKHVDRPARVEVAPFFNLYKILQRIFAAGGLPAEVEAQREAILARAQIGLAITACMLGMEPVARKAFHTAQRLKDFDASDVAKMIARSASSLHEAERIAYCDKLYSLMPEAWRQARDDAVTQLRKS